MVVIGVIVAAAAIALPSFISIFTSGADKQAHNLLSAQLAAARALAIENSTYAAVHVQLNDGVEDDGGTPIPQESQVCYSALFILNNDTGWFELAPNFFPRAMPGMTAFGKLNDTYVDGTGNYKNMGDVTGFTTFTIVFSPDGSVVKQVNNADITFETGEENGSIFHLDDPRQLWEPPGVKPGATAVTLFNYAEFIGRAAAVRADYLNLNGQFIPINVYTGGLFKRR